VNDPRALLARYLAQQQALGETSYTFSSEGESVELMASSKTPAAAPPADTTSRTDAPEKWRKGAPDIPGPGIDIPAVATDLFAGDPLADKDLDQLGELIKVCEQCPLCQERTNAVPGEGPANAELLVVGEGPGANEDQQGRPFVGRAGDLLNDILAAIDCPRPKVFIANIVKCRPPGNRNPDRDEIAACLPYLYRQIAALQPKVILAMGSVAAQSLLETRGPLGSMRNKVHRFRGIPLVVTYHPAALLRNPNWKKPTWDDVRIARRLLAGDA
jgi:DNA polymerase